jgi:hypothetical protein
MENSVEKRYTTGAPVGIFFEKRMLHLLKFKTRNKCHLFEY